MFNTDLALSVAMTTASTLMALAMLPLNLYVWVGSRQVQSTMRICVLADTVSGPAVRNQTRTYNANRYIYIRGIYGETVPIDWIGLLSSIGVVIAGKR